MGELRGSLPPYQPSRQVSGTATSWGHGFLKEMMRDWEQDFHRFQPNVRFQDDLASSAAAIAGLFTGRANLGVLAREIVPRAGQPAAVWVFRPASI